MAGHDAPSSSPDPDRPSRRVRVDGRLAPWDEATAVPSSGPTPPILRPSGGASGKVVVTAIVIGVLAMWGGLNVAFRLWRSAYRERAAYGVARVAEAVVPLAEVVPAGEATAAAHAAAVAGLAAPAVAAAPVEVDPIAWRHAVGETRALLVTLTAANLLDRSQMDALGAAIAARVGRAKARPETARAELAELWDEVGRDAGPNVSRRHPRPQLLPSSAAGHSDAAAPGRAPGP